MPTKTFGLLWWERNFPERANPRDAFAVAVLKDEAIVGFRDRSWSDGSGQGALGGWKRVPRL